jgi:glycolate oxidase FAD binding subunit
MVAMLRPETLKPATPGQVEDALRWAAAEKIALAVEGGGSKRALGRATNTERTLDVGAISGIVAYQPEELVVTARAGTPLAELEAALAERHQCLAFEPGDWSGLLGGTCEAGGEAGGERGGAGTLGGVIACNLSGPRRILSGAARDHLLGFHAVSGRGEEFKSGGTVVKNVTGFDLSKLLSGSHGTLAVMTEASVRALPQPEDARTVLVGDCEAGCGIAAMTAALQSPFEVSGAAHLPADVAALSAIHEVSAPGGAITAIRIEGPGPSCDYRGGKLAALLAAHGTTATLDADATRALWREIRDVRYFALDQTRQVWRLSVPPSAAAGLVAELLFELDGRAFYDWGGGLVWLAIAPRFDASHAPIRSAVAVTGGHATLIRADAPTRATVPVFQPQPTALAALTARVKQGFDPNGILNPGRMYEGV